MKNLKNKNHQDKNRSGNDTDTVNKKPTLAYSSDTDTDVEDSPEDSYESDDSRSSKTNPHNSDLAQFGLIGWGHRARRQGRAHAGTNGREA